LPRREEKQKFIIFPNFFSRNDDRHLERVQSKVKQKESVGHPVCGQVIGDCSLCPGCLDLIVIAVGWIRSYKPKID
jgi:hypothetical protein